MKIAEALLLRADMQKKLAALRERVAKNVLVQEDETPAEDPNVLIATADQVATELGRLLYQINRANLSGHTAAKRPLTEAIAEKDVLLLRHAVYQSAVAAAMDDHDRHSFSEIRWVKAINVPQLQGQIDALAKQIRTVNAEIQAANWLIDVE